MPGLAPALALSAGEGAAGCPGGAALMVAFMRRRSSFGGWPGVAEEAAETGTRAPEAAEAPTGALETTG